MTTPCEFVSKCDVITHGRRGDVKVSVGLDVIAGDPEYHMSMCLQDIAGHQHIAFGGALSLLMVAHINHAHLLAFDEICLPLIRERQRP